MNHSDDEMFDDLHQGVEALKSIAHDSVMPLSEQATQSLNRLGDSMPRARTQFLALKERLAGGAVKAAKKTDQVAHQHPWLFALGALGLGVVTGWFLANSASDDNASV